MIGRFRTWLSARLSWLDEDDPTDGPSYADPVLCTCTPAAIGSRGESCGRCGGSVVFLSEHPTDTAKRTDPKDQP